MQFLKPLLALALLVPLLQTRPENAPGRDVFGVSAAEKEILSYLSLEQLPDGRGGEVTAIRFSGVNVQIVNGLGATNTVDGHGNLIVGYNELGSSLGDDRTGSHNIVGGRFNTFSSFGGFVVGDGNAIRGELAAVCGGAANEATGPSSAVLGGIANEASGSFATVSGGGFNAAAGDYASVGGGLGNEARGLYATVTGGDSNLASGRTSLVGGGFGNEAFGSTSAVLGGRANVAGGDGSALLGGRDNRAAGRWASISGGRGRLVTGDFDWGAGGLFQEE